jgi:hypothetical protein
MVLVLFKIRKEEESIIKPYKRNTIEFIQNNFVLHKSMQGDKCKMMHDATKTHKN